MSQESFDAEYQKHLEDEHQVGFFSAYLQEVIYGGNDGIVTTFAVVSGFNGASVALEWDGVGLTAVLLFGLANLFADGVSMGMSNFLSLRSDADLYRSHRIKESREIRENFKFESEETLHILRDKGISESDAQAFLKLYQKNPEYWVDFMMDYELEMNRPEGTRPWINGMTTFGSFVFFGSMPLIPYFFGMIGVTSFYVSIGFTVFAFICLSLLRYGLTRESLLRCLFENLSIGSVCAIIAYGVGVLFR